MVAGTVGYAINGMRTQGSSMVAGTVGYASTSNFHKACRKAFGVTPRGPRVTGDTGSVTSL